MKRNKNGKISLIFSISLSFSPEMTEKTTENDRKNGSFGCAAKNEFFDFSTKFYSNSSIFHSNSLIFH